MKEIFTATIWQEGKWYIAQCREFEIASQGSTKEEALENLTEAIEAHFAPPVATLVPEVIAFEAEVEPWALVDADARASGDRVD
ncbi:MAG: type II toxin-antitoxin system HicB family antitoxin [Pyrinomonadaceae bacterium]